MLPPPAQYFPLKPGPLRMRPGLQPLGRDLGNGPRDALHFQSDARFREYWLAKNRSPVLPEGRVRSGQLANRDDERRAHAAALEWIAEVARAESPIEQRREALISDPDDSGDRCEIPELTPGSRYGEVTADAGHLRAAYDQLFCHLQEDAVLIHLADGAEEARAIAFHVHLPTHWRPELILGQDFTQIHTPVPDFADDTRVARSLANHMLQGRANMRFVWSLTPDDALDRHPDAIAARSYPSWQDGRGNGWLRVERQVTVPLTRAKAALFLIRVYTYSFADLSATQRERILEVLRSTAEPVLRYKGFWDEREAIADCLNRGTAGGLEAL